jgi:hypothetical protein
MLNEQAPSNDKSYAERPDWSRVPTHTAKHLRGYIERGEHPGAFLEAVLSNDFAGAVAMADEENRRSLPDIVDFLNAYVFSDCWGSKDKVCWWIERKRW